MDAGDLTPPDAVVALRSFPRRFRALVPPGDGTDDDHDRERRAAAEHAAAAAAAAIDAGTPDLRRVLLEDGPELGGAPPPAAGDPVARVAASATALADLAAAQPASVWARTGRRGAATVTAADVLRGAVDAAARELRAGAPQGGAADDDEG